MGYVPEISASLGLSYHLIANHTWLRAVSRSISTPSNSQRDLEDRTAILPQKWDPRWDTWSPGGPPAGAGKYVALISGEDVKPAKYYSFELGYRGSHNHQVQWDFSSFYSLVRDHIGLTPIDRTLNTVVASKANSPDSIVPLYNANLSNLDAFGGEVMMRLLFIGYLQLEMSHSLFWTYRFEGNQSLL